MNSASSNPLLTLNYEPALESLGDDYFDQVSAAEFPQHILRFRNDSVLSQLGLDPNAVTDQHFIEAFGKFQNPPRPLLALRYHGYQFGEYNPALGDGRGFLYGQVRGIDGELYDFGTKGSGRTPYSRGGDGKLTLKGGVREVLAAEALYQMGVRTSRCFTMIETGEALWRGDEPSPTRSSVMVRFNRSHIRFGTFERLHYLGRKDLIQKLLEHVIEYYYPAFQNKPDRYLLVYAELVRRVAELASQWMAAGFCHAVLNTDNMSITGESFDYGPYAFIPTYDPKFTAAYFDYYGRYSYANQPLICQLNIEMLQAPLSAVIPLDDMAAAVAEFEPHYQLSYQQLMLKKLGISQWQLPEAKELLQLTIQLLQASQVGYHAFFSQLTQLVSTEWKTDVNAILSVTNLFPAVESTEQFNQWRSLYHRLFSQMSADEINQSGSNMAQYNPKTVLLRPQIEAIWEPITQEDNWEPFYELLKQIQSERNLT
jgi:uncharacterized protein YdiU (UPF0061 family)